VRAGLLRDALPDADATPENRERMQFIERARALGFDLHEIRDLLCISDGGSREMEGLHATVGGQIESIEQRIIGLMRLRQALLQTRERLERHGPQPHCPIVAALQGGADD
jgi:MerR family mercuric resistance operon transcriptional regulator